MNTQQDNTNATLKQFRDKLDEVYDLAKELPVSHTVVESYMTPLFDLCTDLEYHNERTN